MAATGGEATAKRFRIYTRTGDSGTSCLYTGERLPKDCAFFEAMGDVDELNSCIGVAREFTSEQDEDVAGQLEIIQSRLIDVGAAIATPANAPQGSKVARTRFNPDHIAALESWIDELDSHLPPLSKFILPSGGKAASFLHMARSVCRRAERSVVSLGRMYTAAEKPAPGRAVNASPAPAGTASDDQPSHAVNGSNSNHSSSEAQQGGASVEGQGTATQSGSGDGSAQQGEGAQGQGQQQGVLDPAVQVYLNRLSDYLFTAARYMAHKWGRPEVTYQKQD